MIINGNEYGFCLTLEAGINLAKICPEGDLKRFSELLNEKDYAKAAENLAEIGDILNEGFVRKEHHDHNRVALRLTKGELHGILMNSTLYVYNQINTEMYLTIARDITGEIDAVEKPGKKGKKDETGADA